MIGSSALVTRGIQQRTSELKVGRSSALMAQVVTLIVVALRVMPLPSPVICAHGRKLTFGFPPQHRLRL
jgi:hypothetical protein